MDSVAEWVEGKTAKRKAACWQFYKVKLDPEQNDKVVAVCCKVCGPELSPTFSGNTSNLRSHLAHIHKDLYCKMVEIEGEATGNSATADELGTPTTSSTRPGNLNAILPSVSVEKRKELHKKVRIPFVTIQRSFV